jgi:hypothetical protein
MICGTVMFADENWRLDVAIAERQFCVRQTQPEVVSPNVGIVAHNGSNDLKA